MFKIMKNRYLGGGLLALLMLTGCAKETVVETEPPETVRMTTDEVKFLLQADGDTRFSQQEIDRIIADAVNFLGETTPTRSGSQRTVTSIEPLKMSLGAATRSGETAEEYMFYVVNFADDEGYSVIAADERIEDEIALFVGSGNLDVENVDNPGMQIVLSRLDDYAEASITRHEAWADSMRVVLSEKFTPEQIEQFFAQLSNGTNETRLVPLRPTMTDWMGLPPIGPLIPVEWGQKGTFNDRASEELGGEVYAGCAAIAVAQLMAYWKYPTSYHGLNLRKSAWTEIGQWSSEYWQRASRYKNWSGPMENAPANIQQTVADLIWYIGEDIGMNWGFVGIDQGSGAQMTSVMTALDQMGFSTIRYADFDLGKVIEYVVDGKPVMMEGYSTGGGHGWLIDGYIHQQRSYEVGIIGDLGEPVIEYIHEKRVYFHNNWGADGKYNGYYVVGIFDPVNGVDAPSNTRNQDFNMGLRPVFVEL